MYIKVNIKKLKKTRESLNINKSQLQRESYISREQINNIESWYKNTTMKTLILIVNVFNKINKEKGFILPLIKIEDFIVEEK